MHGGDGDGRPAGVDWNSSALCDAEGWAQQCLGRGGAEANNDPRLDQAQLILEPWKTGAHFADVRRLVQAAFGPCVARPLEVFYRVGDVDIVAVDARGVERVIEETTGRSHKGPALLVFLIAGLLTHHDDARRPWALPEDRLRPHLPQLAAPATGGRRAKLGKRGVRRNEVSG